MIALLVIALLYLGVRFFIFLFWLGLKTKELDKQGYDKK